MQEFDRYLGGAQSRELFVEMGVELAQFFMEAFWRDRRPTSQSKQLEELQVFQYQAIKRLRFEKGSGPL